MDKNGLSTDARILYDYLSDKGTWVSQKKVANALGKADASDLRSKRGKTGLLHQLAEEIFESTGKLVVTHQHKGVRLTDDLSVIDDCYSHWLRWHNAIRAKIDLYRRALESVDSKA